MLGNNKLQLCPGVIYEAVAYYLNHEVLKDGHHVKVTNIVLGQRGGGDDYCVTVEEVPCDTPSSS